jgi:hypothetical protein
MRQQRYEERKAAAPWSGGRFAEKMAGLTRAQTTRLITAYLEMKHLKHLTLSCKM